MLSKKDIEKELGKGINIYPLVADNIKENSINLSISNNCWTQSPGTVYWDGKNFTTVKITNPRMTWRFQKGDSCIVNASISKKPQKQVLLLPHTTTIIETKEVIAVDDYIGGALHSKVGVVSKGIGHIGTMLGPGYCGHLMISLHNITNEVISLPVDSTFVSLAFHYLNTKVKRTSFTTSGHIDKFSSLNIKVSDLTRDFITQDWKTNINGVREKMLNSTAYQQYSKELKKARKHEFLRFLSWKNIIAILLVSAVFIGLLLLATLVDNKNGTTLWVDRFWNVGCSGIICSLLLSFYKFLKED